MMEPSGMDIRGLDYLASMGDMKVLTKKHIRYGCKINGNKCIGKYCHGM